MIMKRILFCMSLTLMTSVSNAQLNYTVQTACHPDNVKHYDTERLRGAFLMEKVMSPDEINLTYTLYDRLIYGGVMPVNQTLVIGTFDELKAEHFLDRRELGVINVGGDGVVTVLGKVKGGGTNQLHMGLTELLPGSVWNTMPAHTHTRRMEAYFYFNVTPGNAICHLIGEPKQQRLSLIHI